MIALTGRKFKCINGEVNKRFGKPLVDTGYVYEELDLGIKVNDVWVVVAAKETYGVYERERFEEVT